MTCPAKEFHCGCAEGECKVPHYEILEAARVTGCGQSIALALLAGAIVAALMLAVMSTANVYFPLTQEQAP
jgi:hypothetical protein